MLSQLFGSGARSLRSLATSPAFQAFGLRGFSTEGPKKLFVGNLPWVATEEDIAQAFQKYGQVIDSFVLTDRESGRSRGMAFITMDAEAADKALQEMNGTNFMGRTLRVEYSLPKDPNRPRGPRPGGFGGGFGGGDGGDRGPRGGGSGRRGPGNDMDF